MSYESWRCTWQDSEQAARAAYAEVQEQARLNGMGSEREVKLLAQLAKVTRERDHWRNNHATEVRRARILKERPDLPIERVNAYEQWGKDVEQLLATQAHAVRLVDALKMALPWVDGETRSHESVRCVINAALSTPINLDALHEAMARECERMAHLFPRGSMPAYNMFEEAAAHRAKKEGK